MAASKDKMDDWEETAALLDAYLRPIAKRPISLDDLKRLASLAHGPHPLDEAGVREPAEALLAEVIARYPLCTESGRERIRGLFAKNDSFAWATGLPFPPATREQFRGHVVLFSILDQGADTRDALLAIRALCASAKAAGIDLAPVLREIAGLSSDLDKYGMGSTRSILLDTAETFSR